MGTCSLTSVPTISEALEVPALVLLFTCCVLASELSIFLSFGDSAPWDDPWGEFFSGEPKRTTEDKPSFFF